MSEYGLPRYDRVKPIFAADRLSSFTHLDFFARFSGKFRNGTEGYWIAKQKACQFRSLTFCYINHCLLYKLASIHVFPKIISVRVRNEVFRSGFLVAVVQLTHVLGDDVIKALASDVIETLAQAHIAKYPCDLSKDVSP